MTFALDMKTRQIQTGPPDPGFPFGRVGLALLVLVAVILLAGCSKTERQGSSVRRWSEHGDQGGVPFSKTGEETTESTETSTTGVDPQAIASAVAIAVKAAIGTSTGGLGLGISDAVTAALAAGMGAYALHKQRQVTRLQVDNDAAWDQASEAKVQAALMTPPPKGKA